MISGKYARRNLISGKYDSIWGLFYFDHPNNYNINICVLFHKMTQPRHTHIFSPGSSRLYRLGVSQAQKVKVSGDERPRLRAS